MIANDILKEKIIDIATRGKLVKNDSSLTKCNIKAIEDIPYEIPNNWVWSKIEYISTYKNGFAFNSSMMNKNSSKGYPVIKSANIGTKEVVINSKTDYISNPTDKMLDCIINKNDILMVLSSQSANVEPLGVSSIYKLDTPALLNQRVLKIICDKKVNPDYILYVVNSKWFHTKLSNKAAGLAQANLKLEHVLSMEVPVPPLEEQNRIVSKILELFELIDKKEKNDKEKDRLKNVLKEKILENAIHGTLIKNNDMLEPLNVEEIKNEVPFDIPSNWKWTFSKCITSNIQYGFTATSDDKGNCKMLRITDIQDNSVNWERVPKCIVPLNDIEKYCLHKNDIVVARTGGTVGKNFLISSVLDNCVFASYLIRLVPNEKINSLYLKYYMDSNFYWKQIADKSKGMAQANVNGKSLSMLKIPLPPLEEQKRIVEKIESLFELIEQL